MLISKNIPHDHESKSFVANAKNPKNPWNIIVVLF